MNLKEIGKISFEAVTLVVIFVCVLLINIYVFSFTSIIGPSMSPTLEENELYLTSKINYKFFEVKRNDIISFITDDEKVLIKRVIGLPGEKLKYIDNKLYINDKEVKEKIKSIIMEDYILEDVIPDNMYFVLGDNRTNSLDSREIGLIHKHDILGKIVFRIWPFYK